MGPGGEAGGWPSGWSLSLEAGGQGTFSEDKYGYNDGGEITAKNWKPCLGMWGRLNSQGLKQGGGRQCTGEGSKGASLGLLLSSPGPSVRSSLPSFHVSAPLATRGLVPVPMSGSPPGSGRLPNGLAFQNSSFLCQALLRNWLLAAPGLLGQGVLLPEDNCSFKNFPS